MSCLASEELLGCTSCSLHLTRTQVVPGHGNVNASIAFVAEAPGYDEDQQGEPLVGAAGRRFDRQLEAAGLKREDVWLDNAVHCRPPGNKLRNYPDALARCPDLWLYKALYALPKLKVVVAMGATAGGIWFPGVKATELSTLARTFLPTAAAFGGSLPLSHLLRAYVAVGSFHPAAAVYQGGGWNHIDESIATSMMNALDYSRILEASSNGS